MVLGVSTNNEGASSLAGEIESKFGVAGMKVTPLSPPQPPPPSSPGALRRMLSLKGSAANLSGVSTGSSSSPIPSPLRAAGTRGKAAVEGALEATRDAYDGASAQRSAIFGADARPPQPTHVLLYLNSATFVGEAGGRLAKEMRDARARRIPIVLVHETDPMHGGCPFERFFQSTPQDLIDDGLFRKIATACHPAPHRAVSIALIARSLGAEPRNSTCLRSLHGLLRLKRGMSAELSRGRRGAADYYPSVDVGSANTHGARRSDRRAEVEDAEEPVLQAPVEPKVILGTPRKESSTPPVQPEGEDEDEDAGDQDEQGAEDGIAARV